MRHLTRLPLPLARVIELLATLPGIGPKSAMRLGLSLLHKPAAEVAQLATALAELHDKVGYCPRCGCLTERDRCQNCARNQREGGLICVVEQPADVLMLERGGFAGSYHVLHGRLSPVDGIGPAQLRLSGLDERVQAGEVSELILATSATVDGEATAHFVAERYRNRGVAVSRISRGIPEGGELEYIDEYTISRAMQQRVRWHEEG